MAKPGSPIFKCSRRNEVPILLFRLLIKLLPLKIWRLVWLFTCCTQVVYGDVYMLDDEMKWKVLPPMPKPNSHIECAWVIVNNSIIITGGTTEKHPVTKRMILVGEVFQFHLDSLVCFFQPLVIKMTNKC